MFKVLFLIGVPLWFSCSESQAPRPVPEPRISLPKQVIEPLDEFKKGELIPFVRLRSDTTQEYALYLPLTYDIKEKFPVIIFFDPKGDGSLPLNLYRSLADKHKVILIGSNSSKNGMDMEVVKRIANNLVDEAINRVAVDPAKITLMGFSGGAKVALICAASNPHVSKVIYSGASLSVDINHPLSILGFAGKRDMNYSDLVAYERSMKNAPVPHFLVEWNGKHEFPSTAVFEDAFIFIETGSVNHYERKQVSISDSELNKEQEIKQGYMDAFRSEDLEWWRKEVNTLNLRKKGTLMNERLLGFISLACYSLTNNALKQNDVGTAEYILRIYKLADPENTAIVEFGEEIRRRKGQ